MKFLKIFVRFILRLFSPDLEFRLVNQYHFNQLGRKAPELQWESLAPAPVAVYDAGAAQIGQQLFLFGGSLVSQGVSNKIYILDLKKCAWREGGTLPEGVPESHSAVVPDRKRFIYFLSGQMGPECRPATKECFIYDTIKRSWEKMPPMPYARYAPAAQLWGGRLHVLGGSKEDRNTPARDHCSIAVENGKALEKSWREEAPIPRGGCDRASIVLDDHLYVLGGQEGDWINDPRVATYQCTRDFITEIMYPDTYRMKSGSNEWERLADMPVKSSHTEFAVFQLNKRIVLVGGQHDCSNDITRVTDAIQAYDAASNSWKIIGRLPYCTKTISVCYNGWLYFTTGQRDRLTGGPGMAGDYDRSLWRARFDRALL